MIALFIFRGTNRLGFFISFTVINILASLFRFVKGFKDKVLNSIDKLSLSELGPARAQKSCLGPNRQDACSTGIFKPKKSAPQNWRALFLIRKG
jgi:hypothetical protein